MRVIRSISGAYVWFGINRIETSVKLKSNFLSVCKELVLDFITTRERLYFPKMAVTISVIPHVLATLLIQR